MLCVLLMCVMMLSLLASNACMCIYVHVYLCACMCLCTCVCICVVLWCNICMSGDCGVSRCVNDGEVMVSFQSVAWT